MARNPPSVDASVATTRELLNAALARSARRNARVANLRIAFRWAVWASGQLLKYILIALLIAAPVALGWHYWQDPAAGGPAAAPTATVATPAPPAPRPAPPPAVNQATPKVDDKADPPPTEAAVDAPAPGVTPSSPGTELRLRLDDSVTQAPGAAAAQSPDSPHSSRKTDNP